MAILSDKKYDRMDKTPGMSSTGDIRITDSKSYIGRTLSINGDIKSNEEITIEGNVKGTINVDSSLIIGKEGSVNAEIKAKEVVIMGKVEGTITATNRVEIVSNGEFLGDVNSKKLIIKEGAIFKGNVNMEVVPDINFPSIKTEPQKPQNLSKPYEKK